jgi:hypothetical protein
MLSGMPRKKSATPLRIRAAAWLLSGWDQEM